MTIAARPQFGSLLRRTLNLSFQDPQYFKVSSMTFQQKETILIVDDQEENLRIVSEVLSRTAYNVLLANSAEEAYRRLNEHTPALILLDVMMPGTDGLSVCRQIKAENRWAQIPVIFLSADDDKNVIVQALESGGWTM